jgi:hypothetical protein
MLIAVPSNVVKDRATHKKPVKVLSVDIEAEVKAGHEVDPESEMQVSAIAPDAVASIDNKTVLFLIPPALFLRLLEASASPGVDESLPSDIAEFRRVLGAFVWRSKWALRQVEVDTSVRSFPSLSSTIFCRDLDYQLIHALPLLRTVGSLADTVDRSPTN